MVRKASFLLFFLCFNFICISGFSVVFAQGTQIGENTDLWRVRGNAQYGLPANTGTWHGDSLWVGATFLRDSTKRFIVWLADYYAPQASYHGALYIMIPRQGRPDSAFFLFYNRCNGTAPTSVDLTNITPTIHHLDTLFFMYRSFENNSGGGACGNWTPLTNDAGVYQADSLFTGPNRAPGEGWLNIDRHYSARNSATMNNPNLPSVFYSLNQQKNVPYGRRWCEAAWVHTALGGAIRTDTVEFGFEDQFNGDDINYEDIKFNVTGVFLIGAPNKMTLQVSDSCIRAGDTASIKATLYRNNVPDTSAIKDSVTWRLDPATTKPGDWISSTKGQTIKVSGTMAYRSIGVIAAYRGSSTGLIDTAWICVVPNVPTQVDIGLQNSIRMTRVQVAASIDSFSVKPRLTANLTLAQSTDYLYAVLRDRYANFCWLADTSQWISLDNAVAGALFSVNGAFECTISRGTARRGNTMVIVSENTLNPDTADIVLSADTLMALRLVDARNPTVALDTIKLIEGDSMTVKVQALWSSNAAQWVDVTGTWTLNPTTAIAFGAVLPPGLAGQWACKPLSPGKANLTVVSSNVSVTVPVVALPGPAGLDSAVTRDINGNGLIDRIDVYFKRDIAVNNPSGAGVSVQNKTVIFTVDSMRTLSTNAYAVYIREQQTNPSDPLAQSSWTPTVTLTGIAGVQNAAIVAIDGCQPVAWKADLFGASVRKLDTLRVVLSEKIIGLNGSAFSTATSPYLTFNAWLKNQGGGFTSAPNKFVNIGSFLKIERDSILYFLMGNDSAVVDNNYLNIKYQPSQLRDARGNVPTETNQKIPIKIHGAFGFTVIAGPNPFVMGTTPFSIANQPSCCVKIEINLIVPNGDIGTSAYVTGSVTILDALGNVLASDKSLGRDEKDAKKMFVVWDGKNKRGGVVAGGTYVARVTLTKPSSGETIMHTTALGVKTSR